MSDASWQTAPRFPALARRGLASDTDTAPPRSPAARRPDRIVGIDAGRAIGVVAVVLIHTAASRPLGFGIDAGRLIDQLCRWAVPFYFVASGYFLACRIDGPVGPMLRAVVARLGVVFLTWSAIYLLLSRTGPSRLLDPAAAFRWLVTGEPAWHLWFLSALATCLALLLVLHRSRMSPGAMAAGALALYAVGLALGSYHGAFVAERIDPAQIASRTPLLDGRGGPFPFVFVVAGYWIARAGRPPRWLGPSLLAGGAGLHLAEATALDALGWFPFAGNDFLIGTLAFGTGAFLVAQDWPASPVMRHLASVGPWSLGVYCCHVLFIAPLRKLVPWSDLTGNLLLAALVLSASVAAVAALSRLRPLRPLLT